MGVLAWWDARRTSVLARRDARRTCIFTWRDARRTCILAQRELRRMGALFCLRDAPLDAFTDEGCHRHVMQAGVGVHTVCQLLWHACQECPVRLPLQFS
jgi:hypothetical protein